MVPDDDNAEVKEGMATQKLLWTGCNMSPGPDTGLTPVCSPGSGEANIYVHHPEAQNTERLPGLGPMWVSF